MSLEQYALNERIALALGFRQELGTDAYWHAPGGYEWWDLPGIPDWAGDKNLTHQEKTNLFKAGSFDLYKTAIEFISLRDAHNESGLFEPHLANAAQEAEAILMVLEGLSKP